MSVAQCCCLCFCLHAIKIYIYCCTSTLFDREEQWDSWFPLARMGNSTRNMDKDAALTLYLFSLGPHFVFIVSHTCEKQFHLWFGKYNVVGVANYPSVPLGKHSHNVQRCQTPLKCELCSVNGEQIMLCLAKHIQSPACLIEQWVHKFWRNIAFADAKCTPNNN